MGSNDVSSWLIALIGTIATAVGAIAAIITVYQNRQANNHDFRPSGKVAANPRSFSYETERNRNLGKSLGFGDSDLPEIITITLWGVAALLIAWMIKVLAGIRSDTIPTFLLMAIPALAGILAGILALVGSLGQLLNFDGSDLISSIWHLVVAALNILIVTVAIKICF